MNRLLVPSLSLALLITIGGTFGMGGAAQASSNDQQTLMADMTGAAEVPGPGDAAGSGMAMLTVDPGAGTICVDSTAPGIALPITGAHIHEAAAGVAGPVIVPFIGGGGPLAPSPDPSVSGCVTVDNALAQSIWDNPENYYFNLHNADFPAGAVRGQLMK